MKLDLIDIKRNFSEEQTEVIKKFLEYLQKELPLKDDVKIHFTSERYEHMTTGLRIGSPSTIYVLSNHRMISDILRTLSHEWAHEFQHQKLGLRNDAKVPAIGGPVEDFANTIAGIMVKSFETNHPELKKILYNEVN